MHKILTAIMLHNFTVILIYIANTMQWCLMKLYCNIYSLINLFDNAVCVF